MIQMNPHDDYHVTLETFCGPLDLLLFLVKRDEIDLHDIPIARLTEQYLEHLEQLQRVDMDVAGEFLVMAATLLEIKSALIVPHGADEDSPGTEDPTAALDPRHDLVQQLLAYKRFKDASNDLADRMAQWHTRYAHVPARVGPDRAEPDPQDGAESAEALELDLEDVHVLDLCEAFARLLESVGADPARHEVVYDDTPISLHAEDILDRLRRDASGSAMTLGQIFEGRRSRAEMIGLFLATLELVRQRKVRVLQERLGGEIRLQLRPQEEQVQGDQPADWRDPQTGEVQYEWPSEAARQRAERRAKLRIARAKGELKGDEAEALGTEGIATMDEAEQDDAAAED